MSHGTDKQEKDSEAIARAVDQGKTISLKTYVLSEYGERALELISQLILKKYGRDDLLEIVYPAAKELAVNATKANLKRAVFNNLGLDPEIDDEYHKGMEVFKEKLTEKGLDEYRDEFKKENLPVTMTFYYSEEVLNIKVKNNFRMLPVEESRVREKFRYAKSFTNLLEFYLAHGDSSEGAGLGLTMVGILLDESGIDRHGFTLYVKEGYEETAAKLEIPLSDSYISKRNQFAREAGEQGLSEDEYRNYIKGKATA